MIRKVLEVEIDKLAFRIDPLTSSKILEQAGLNRILKALERLNPPTPQMLSNRSMNWGGWSNRTRGLKEWTRQGPPF